MLGGAAAAVLERVVRGTPDLDGVPAEMRSLIDQCLVKDPAGRPAAAALLAEVMQRAHVDLVDVRPLLAVDLDGDEQLVHHGSRGVVLKTFVGHHMAPVAGGIADREQDRPVGPLGLGQGLRSPRPPVDRVVLMLQQIGTGFCSKPVIVRRNIAHGAAHS